MAILAQLRRPADQQRGLIGAVRKMADAAVLGGWRMLPQKRTLHFRVADVTGLVDRCLANQCIAHAGTDVRVVAVATGKLVIAHGMRRQLQEIRAHLAVAGQAPLRLARLRAHGIHRIVDAVTVGTRYVSLFVSAAGPAGTTVILMTGEAEVVLQLGRDIAPLSEVDDRRPCGAVPQHVLTVIADRAMAGLALQARREGMARAGMERRGLDARMAVHVGEDRRGRKRLRLVMARQAGIRPAAGILAAAPSRATSVPSVALSGSPVAGTAMRRSRAARLLRNAAMPAPGGA